MKRFRAIRPAALGACILLAPSFALAQRPLNAGFERASVADSSLPWGWSFGWSAFAGGPGARFSLDSIRHEGEHSLRIEIADSTVTSPQTIMLQLPAAFARGREVAISAWVRSAGPRARPLTTLEAWGDQVVAAADTARPSGANNAWRIEHLTIRVPADSSIHSIVITVGLEGSGTSWFDDLTFSVDGTRLDVLPATADAPTRQQLAWLRRHASPLRSVDASENDADLARVGRIIGSARVVGLGESTHGTREFFQAKHRILRYLVERLGFRVFAIEANQLAVERINAYVHGGSGTAAEVIRVMFRVWNTEEMVALVEWMREWNASHPDRAVRFTGYDMQDHKMPGDTLRAFLARVAPGLVGDFDRLTAEYRAQRSSATPQVEDSVRARWGKQAEDLNQLVSGHRLEWLAAARSYPDSIAAEWAVQSANLLRQAARFNVALSSPERDSLMAANLDWVLRTLEPGARTVVWAHDVHVSHGGDAALSFNGGAQMGAHLMKTFGYDYRAFTLLTDDGAYTAARSFTDHRMVQAEGFPGPAGSMEEALHRLARPRESVGWIVDLRPARSGADGEWLRQPRPIRHIGYAAYDYGFELQAVLPLEFDGIVFVDRTGPSRLTR